jgi:hypothetical protein
VAQRIAYTLSYYTVTAKCRRHAVQQPSTGHYSIRQPDGAISLVVSFTYNQWRTEDFWQGCRKYIFRGTYPPLPVKSEFRHSITLIFKCFWFFLINKDTKKKKIKINLILIIFQFSGYLFISLLSFTATIV